MTPTQDTARHWPAEWEPHAATVIAWPHNQEDWPGKFSPVPYVFAEVVRALVPGEKVVIIVRDAAMGDEAQALLEDSGIPSKNVQLVTCLTDRIWTRDTGPTVVRDNGNPLALHWCFNGWAKYEDHQNDQAVAPTVADSLNIPIHKAEYVLPDGTRHWLVLEGGSIEGNGKGSLLTTEECLLSSIQARNPLLSRKQMEEAFHQQLGITNTLWLNRGIAGDDTHGHIDDLARFTDASTIVTVVENDPSDENYEPLQENLIRLRSMTDQSGRPFRIATLPMPSPVVFCGQRLPASYANFYIANAATLVPVFNDPRDREALNIIQELIPDRPVHPINCRDLVLGLGTLHCMTQQVPA